MIEKIAHLTRALSAKRVALALSQRALSNKTGIPQSHISRIEQAEVDLKTSSLVELARVLELEVMLVPRELKGIVAGIIAGDSLEQTPAFSLEHYQDDED